MDVFGLSEETGVPRENQRSHRKARATLWIQTQDHLAERPQYYRTTVLWLIKY